MDPALPACAALAMPNLDLSHLEGTGTLRARTQQQTPGALVAGMASLAVLCGVAAAGVSNQRAATSGSNTTSAPTQRPRTHRNP